MSTSTDRREAGDVDVLPLISGHERCSGPLCSEKAVNRVDYWTSQYKHGLGFGSVIRVRYVRFLCGVHLSRLVSKQHKGTLRFNQESGGIE